MNSSNEGRHDDEAALTEFLSSLMDYTPTIPDELVEHYLGKSGFQCPDLRLHCKARLSAPVKDKSKQPKEKRLVLTMDDLSRALREYGVNLKHPDYFADSPLTGMDPSSREE
ncbi:transcription initiation factor TFIID subunit 10 isoform X2 [Dendrobium catenatum]|uniref:transcription initiation factor TFIID subunit 10 isoform X2 n=1 Tax=Dendrobium catenatum TaxID=906689 RepID=UPI0010A09FD9|nr:transcription initiation factor TFIID subunit 10 isoform X2 [Dendrobium catenatum]